MYRFSLSGIFLNSNLVTETLETDIVILFLRCALHLLLNGLLTPHTQKYFKIGPLSFQFLQIRRVNYCYRSSFATSGADISPTFSS